MTATPVLRVDNVHKSYGRRPVLRGASVELNSGEIIAIVGENGSGKSTLIKVISGLLPADKGSIRVDGTLGYCPQELVLYDRLTVREHFRLFGAAYNLGDKAIAEAGQLYLQEFNYARYLNTLVGELSGGTKQKLNLTLALIHSPDLLLLDEPYQGFDHETFLVFLDLLNHFREQGKAALIISHLITREIRCNRVLTLKDGSIREGATYFE